MQVSQEVRWYFFWFRPKKAYGDGEKGFRVADAMAWSQRVTEPVIARAQPVAIHCEPVNGRVNFDLHLTHS